MLARMKEDLPRTLLRSSWWAILLGLLLEALQLAVGKGAGGAVPGAGAVLAESAQKVTWSWIVCVALACGTAATRMAPGALGLLGMLSAPVAFGAARAVHKGVAAAVSADMPPGASPWLLAGVKAAEYAVFGLLVARLARRQPAAPLPAFVGRGLLVGAAFGALLLFIMDRAAAPAGLPMAVLLARGVNELFFPVGCACVLWSTGALTRKAA